MGRRGGQHPRGEQGGQLNEPVTKPHEPGRTIDTPPSGGSREKRRFGQGTGQKLCDGRRRRSKARASTLAPWTWFLAGESTEPVPGGLLRPGAHSEFDDLLDGQVPTESKCAHQLSVLSPQPPAPTGLLELLGGCTFHRYSRLSHCPPFLLTPSQDLSSSRLHK